MKRLTSVGAACVASGLLLVGTFGFSASAALAANGSGSSNHVSQHCDPSDPTCGVNPALTGPIPPFVSVVGNCPDFVATDSWILNFVSGNAHSHFTANKNGDWGGGTAEGQAEFTTSDGTVQYAGHLTEWFGQGSNSPTDANQTEMGFTLDFHGTGIAGNLAIHANQHVTTNNAGTTTSNIINATVTCS